MKDLISDLLTYLPELDRAELERAVKIVSAESGVSEDGLVRLCILNAGMGGLVVSGCKENGADATEFLRNVYRKLVLRKQPK